MIPTLDRRRGRKSLFAVATVVVTLLGLAIGANNVLQWSLERLLVADATFAAADILVAMSAGGAEHQELGAGSGRLRALRLTNRNGSVLLERDDANANGLPPLLSASAPALTPRVFSLGEESWYVDVAVPTAAGGALTIRFDQTAKRDLLWSEVKQASWVLACISIIAFLLPATAYYSQWRKNRAAKARIEYLAHHDGMTGVLNRASLLERLEEALASRRPEHQVAVHYVDLDRFKEVNDTLGHDVGDELLRQVAERLRGITRATDFVARFGGDEFAILQANLEVPAAAEALGKRVVEALRQPFAIRDHDIQVSASVGIATAPEHASTSGVLLKAADLALYNAKACGRDGFRIFNPDMDLELKARRKMESQIRNAAARGEFELHFQPIMGSRGGELKGFEALLRLPDGEGGFVSPTTFVPIAEEMGAISKIGSWVLKQACSKAVLWPDHLMVAVNLSPAQFSDGSIVDDVRSALSETGLLPSRLELEITEGLLLSSSAAILEQLVALKELGVSIAMDDFGTGYSSLAYLWKFPFDKIKIDRSFMEALDQNDPNIGSILKTIVSLGHSLEMKVTAEGVETGPQAAFLDDLSCDYVQGYLFGRPVTEVDAHAVIDQSTRRRLARDCAAVAAAAAAA
jgi:diguanylate cyclase (GGDEF)-like protein